MLASSAQWGYGATAAHLTPDQKVRSPNLSGLTCSPCALSMHIFTVSYAHVYTLSLFWAEGPVFLETAIPVFLPLKRQVEDD